MTRGDARRDHEPVSLRGLWFGLFAGPVAWSLRLVLSYALVSVACVQDWGFILHLVSAAFFVLAIIGAFVAWRGYRTVRAAREAGDREYDEWSAERTYFMALLGLLSSGLFALVILAEWLTVFFTDPCIVR